MKQGIFPIFLMVFVFFSTLAFGQKGNIHGYVKEAETGDAMIGASVFIQGTSTGTVTDFNGEFTLAGIKVGEVTVEFTYLGFSPITQVITVTKGTQELEIAMEYEAVSLIEGEVIVTAQASAQMAAVNKQRTSKTIANVISVKRIQELPDANAAEVVGRLPGISLQRDGGEGSKVVIRGLAPKYNNVTIEGVKLASTGGDNRSSDMSMISPYMLEGIEVFKAALPDKEADAHGGSINFVLKEAPNKFKMDAFVSAATSNLHNTGSDYKLVLGASNRFFRKKLGIFAQVDYENRNRTAHNVYVSYVPYQPIFNDTKASVSNISLTKTSRDIKRSGGAVVLDYKIKNGSLKMSNFISAINRDVLSFGDIFGMQYNQHFHQYSRTKSNLFIHTGTLAFEKTLGSFILKLNGSTSTANNVTPESLRILALEDSGFLPGVKPEQSLNKILSLVKNDYANTRLERISLQNSKTSENQKAVGGSLKFQHSIGKHSSFSYKIGGKLKVLSKTRDIDSKNIPVSWGLHGGKYREAIIKHYDNINPGGDVPYSPLSNTDFDDSDFLDGRYPLSHPFDLDVANTLASIAKDSNLYLLHYPTDKMSDYSGDERYWAGFAMMTYKYKSLLTFTPGVRYENNQTNYTGVRGDALALDQYQGYRHTTRTTKRQNEFFLPMVHLKLSPLKWLNIRMAYTQTLSRPDFTQIVPSWNITLAQVFWNNPYLQPSKSDNFDFYLSSYQSKVGLISAGFFRKSIKNLIFDAGLSSATNPKEFDGLPNNQKGKNISKIVNNKFALTIWGVETEYKTRFWYANNFLKGVVLNLNYTHIFSEVKYPISLITREFIAEPPFIISSVLDTFYTDHFLEQPNDIFNATIGYDYKGFSARVSYLFRTEIFKQSQYWPSLRADSDNYSRWDISFKQKIPENLELLLNIANPFDKPERVRLTDSGAIISEQNYGMTIDLGIRYRFQ